MTLQQYFRENKLTPYTAAKQIGIPWETLEKVYLGELSLSQCGEGTLLSLAKALHTTEEDLLKMGLEPTAAPSHLESGLPGYLKKDILAFEDGLQHETGHLDCLWGELYGSINAAQWGGEISKAQADHLRKKYLFDEEEDHAVD